MSEGTNIAGVQFRRAGRIYDFLIGDLIVKIGDDVVVDTERGPSLAKIASVRFDVPLVTEEKPIRNVMRVATSRDLEDAQRLTAEKCVQYARERAEALKLKMTILQADVQFGGNKAIIFFSAPGRVDFRHLVKELASGLKTRVELKQVGARDEAKLIGGLGICGREYCCSSFLREFIPVSIKMAKNQNLALNPTKVSGGCGRLLCCLTYENDQYTEMRKELPKKGVMMRSVSLGVDGKVIKSDVLNQTVMLEGPDGKYFSAKLADLEKITHSSRTERVEQEAAEWADDIDLDELSEDN